METDKRNKRFYDFLKIGGSFFLGAFITYIVAVRYTMATAPDSVISMMRKLHDVQNEQTVQMPDRVQYYNVKTKKGEGRIHTRMPKDSVIMILGEPDDFIANDLADEIEYHTGKDNKDILSIVFEDEKVAIVNIGK